LPMEDGVNLIARGSDSLWPHIPYWDLLHDFNDSPCRFLRRFLPRDQDATGCLLYRSIPGPLAMKEGPSIPYAELAKAWIWFQRNNLWPRTAHLPWQQKEAYK